MRRAEALGANHVTRDILVDGATGRAGSVPRAADHRSQFLAVMRDARPLLLSNLVIRTVALTAGSRANQEIRVVEPSNFVRPWDEEIYEVRQVASLARKCTRAAI